MLSCCCFCGFFPISFHDVFHSSQRRENQKSKKCQLEMLCRWLILTTTQLLWPFLLLNNATTFLLPKQTLGDFHFVFIFKIHHRRESSSKKYKKYFRSSTNLCTGDWECEPKQNEIFWMIFNFTCCCMLESKKKTRKTSMHGKEWLEHDEVDWNYLDSWSICKAGKAKVKSIYIHEKYFKFHHNTFNHGDPGCYCNLKISNLWLDWWTLWWIFNSISLSISTITQISRWIHLKFAHKFIK